MDKKKVIKGIVITVIVAGLIFGAVVVANRFKAKNVEDTAQGFNGIVERTKKKHPSLYAWWISLTTDKQIIIENSMNEQILTYLSVELAKNELSSDVKEKLAKYGYIA
jgi:hypothetical protein